MIEVSNEVVLARILKGDRYFGKSCFECTSHPAAFFVRGQVVSVCPRCVQDRIAALEAELGGLPDDLEWFRGEAEREVAFQERKEAEALSVNWDYVAKCHRCGHLAEYYEVRFPDPDPGEIVRHPHCYACYLVWRAEKGK